MCLLITIGIYTTNQTPIIKPQPLCKEGIDILSNNVSKCIWLHSFLHVKSGAVCPQGFEYRSIVLQKFLPSCEHRAHVMQYL